MSTPGSTAPRPISTTTGQIGPARAQQSADAKANWVRSMQDKKLVAKTELPSWLQNQSAVTQQRKTTRPAIRQEVKRRSGNTDSLKSARAQVSFSPTVESVPTGRSSGTTKSDLLFRPQWAEAMQSSLDKIAQQGGLDKSDQKTRGDFTYNLHAARPFILSLDMEESDYKFLAAAFEGNNAQQIGKDTPKVLRILEKLLNDNVDNLARMKGNDPSANIYWET